MSTALNNRQPAIALNLPSKKVSLDEDIEGVVDLIEAFIVQAEKELPGIDHGEARFNLVLDAVLASVELGWFWRRWRATLVTRLVYETIARKMPDNLRSSKLPKHR